MNPSIRTVDLAEELKSGVTAVDLKRRFPRQTASQEITRVSPALVVCAGLVLLAVPVVVAITFGPADLSVAKVWAILIHKMGIDPDSGASTLEVAMVWELRLTKYLLAAACGAGLSIAGVIVQSLLHNPLAEPYLLSVSSRTSTGAAVILVLGADAMAMSLSIGAFAGSLVSFAAMLLLARLADSSTDKIILAGVAVTQGFSALTSLIIMVGPARTPPAASCTG